MNTTSTNSTYSKRIAELVSQGMTRAEARKKIEAEIEASKRRKKATSTDPASVAARSKDITIERPKSGMPKGKKMGEGISLRSGNSSTSKSSETTTSNKSSSGKRTYAEAKKADPKLDSYIKRRNALRAAGETGSAEYKAVQNKINAAYGVSKRRVERDSAPMQKIASRELSTAKPKPEAKLQTSGSKPKSSSSGSPKSSSSSTSKSSNKLNRTGFLQKTGVEAKDKSLSRALADIGIEPSKEVSFDSPSRKDRRKARRKAVREVRRSMKQTGGLKDVPSDNKGLPNLPKSVRNKMGYKKTGGKKKMGGMKDRRR